MSNEKIKDVAAPGGEILPVTLQPEAMAVLQRVHHLVMLLDTPTVEQRVAMDELNEILRRYGFSSG